MNSKSKLLLTIALALLPLGVGLALFVASKPGATTVQSVSAAGSDEQQTDDQYSSSETNFHADARANGGEQLSPLGRLWQEAYRLYEKEQYDEAEALVKPHWQALVDIENGCDLLASIYAETKNMEAVERASKTCFASGHASDTIYEALAYSLSYQGKSEEAIEILEGQLKQAKSFSPRLHVAIARLHLMLGQDVAARKQYLGAVKGAEVWSMWVSYALKIPPLATNTEFLSELMEAVIEKPDVNEAIERRLLEAAKDLKEHDSYRKLKSRLLRHSQSEAA